LYLAVGDPTAPRHQIITAKSRALGTGFGGAALLETTIAGLVAAPYGRTNSTRRASWPKDAWQAIRVKMKNLLSDSRVTRCS
jgi:hypothetical protein